jgi:hypothetical protein
MNTLTNYLNDDEVVAVDRQPVDDPHRCRSVCDPKSGRQEARLDRASADSLILFLLTKSQIETSTPPPSTSQSGMTNDPKIGPCRLRGRDIQLAALETAKRTRGEEPAWTSAKPLCDDTARIPTSTAGASKRPSPASNSPAMARLDHPMLLVVCRARLERALAVTCVLADVTLIRRFWTKA